MNARLVLPVYARRSSSPAPPPPPPPRHGRALPPLRLAAAPHPTAASISPRLLCTDFFPFLRHRLLSVPPRAFPRFDAAATPSTNTARVPITPNERTERADEKTEISFPSHRDPFDSIYRVRVWIYIYIYIYLREGRISAVDNASNFVSSSFDI